MHFRQIANLTFIGLILSLTSISGAPCNPIVEVQTASVDRTKVGYAEFQQSSPPEWKIYKSEVTSYYEVWDAWSFAAPPAIDSSELYTMLYTWQRATTDPNNYTLNGPLQEYGCTAISAPESLAYAGEANFFRLSHYSNGGTTSESCEAFQDASGQWSDPEQCLDRVADCNGGPETLTISTATTQRHSWSRSESHESGWNECFGYSEVSLEDEYTTAELIQRLSGDLNAAAYSGWSQGSATASFHLTSYKKCGTASKFKARIRFSASPGISCLVSYTMETNYNGIVSSQRFTGSATDTGGGNYVFEVPEVIPVGPEMDISF